MPEDIHVTLNNGSNYDYYFIKEIAKDFKGELNFMDKMLKYIYIFSVPITKEVRRIDKMQKNLQKPDLTN